MKTFVADDGRLIGVIEQKIELPYWTPYGRQVQIRTDYEFMHRNFKMPMHQADAWKEASCLHSDA
ncbi:hypothetical protein PsaNZ64_10185 [Pseudomonas syringae pv. actinidiae]|uniref:hypothetical protein n=1 Tax=Pseudomonas syringae TaxID=317 RepID=UPI000940CF4D|nr:hypothetical protein [Pseudomonas syringae]OKS75503.1 hypothetical protein PsaNZ64_10185 [Pseudomonas syringae pv. actinidiae]QOU99687.1 hypothetical protein [Pseudomonas syringae pv. actinidiae]